MKLSSRIIFYFLFICLIFVPITIGITKIQEGRLLDCSTNESQMFILKYSQDHNVNQDTGIKLTLSGIALIAVFTTFLFIEGVIIGLIESKTLMESDSLSNYFKKIKDKMRE